ncbi:efflux RND transporter permease subunit [Dinoroseobacter sp. S124A]|uniref:efflux RND transporter permease subunit n=1 Tax=Dinoroseobacter sp. S124A TaxID=3415128 RepID=UPI003C7B917B
MTGLVDWAASRARMVIAFVALSLLAGTMAYIGLPKEGEPDIEIPALFVSVPFPGISAEDSEKLVVQVMETELSDLDGLDRMSSTASDNYAGVVLEFEFGWDKTKIIADVRDRMNTAEAKFPSGYEKYSINEINFSQFPIIVVNLSGALPERTLLRVANDLQDTLEGLEPVLEAGLAGHRDEMLEVVIDPLRLESYNVTAGELLSVVQNNNQLIAAGEVETAQGAFAVKIPSAFDEQTDVLSLPVKVSGDRVVTLGDIADIRLTFEDRTGTARYNGDDTVALQVVKRKGFNLIDTATLVRETVEAERQSWPRELRESIEINVSMDQSRIVDSMVRQLEGSVLTAIALVMIVVLAALGTRSALLVGFAIPTSFLLCFALLAVMGITVSNIVMFGLILAVGMLVDGAIVVVEYADRRISEGSGPMAAYTEAAKRMFWPIVSSTATTLCAFLPMLFWPGVAGQFMGMLPVTLIFVLTASLVVALIYLPVVGGVAGRISRTLDNMAKGLMGLPWLVRAALALASAGFMYTAVLQFLNPTYLLGPASADQGWQAYLPGAGMMLLAALSLSVTLTSIRFRRSRRRVRAGFRRSPFGWFIRFLTGNPIMPLVAIGTVIFLVVTTFGVFQENNRGVEFFVASEPEQAIVYVRARGNHSLEEKDALLRQAEEITMARPGIESVFAFAGEGGLNQNTGGAAAPLDTVGTIQIELAPWEDRQGSDWADGNDILDALEAELKTIPGVQTEILEMSQGPAGAKPVHMRLTGDDFDALAEAAATVRAGFEATEGLRDVEDTRPLPGIDWQIDVDVAAAGRYGADVATVGAMVQLVTRGILLDTMRVPSSDEEIEIRVRLPEEDRVLSTLDTLRVRTAQGLVPLSNFITRAPVPKLGQIDRVDGHRYYDVKAGVRAGLLNKDGAVINAAERIALLTTWMETEVELPEGVSWEWTGEQEDEAESQAFLMNAFAGALGLMFIILLAQFNSFYNAFLVLLAVVLSTTGVLIGMIVMEQPFSVIMTGTGIVALAGIVVNNNIVLIDTYQEYARYMPRLEAIARTAQVRIRPVLLTTITTMAGLAPMMFGLSLDFFGGGYTVDSPTALWWKQLATAVVFGLGVATVLTLVLTPSLLALRVWLTVGAYSSVRQLRAMSLGKSSRVARDLALKRAARAVKSPEILWIEDDQPQTDAETGGAPAEARTLAERIVDSTARGDEGDDPTPPDGTIKPPLRAAE